MRSRADAIKSQVTGFYKYEMLDETSGLAGISHFDMERIRMGYACANGLCRATFAHYTFQCPVCGHERDLEEDIAATPAPWQEHVDERARPTHRTRSASSEDALAHLAISPDVERIPLSKLKPSRWGRK